MVYEYLSRCFILEDQSLGFSELFQVVVVATCGEILRSVALMLGASRLLVMAKDIGGLHFTTISEVFL